MPIPLGGNFYPFTQMSGRNFYQISRRACQGAPHTRTATGMPIALAVSHTSMHHRAHRPCGTRRHNMHGTAWHSVTPPRTSPAHPLVGARSRIRVAGELHGFPAERCVALRWHVLSPMHCTSLSAAAAALAAALLLPAALLLAAAAAAASLLPLTPYFFVRNDTSAACFAAFTSPRSSCRGFFAPRRRFYIFFARLRRA